MFLSYFAEAARAEGGEGGVGQKGGLLGDGQLGGFDHDDDGGDGRLGDGQPRGFDHDDHDDDDEASLEMAGLEVLMVMRWYTRGLGKNVLLRGFMKPIKTLQI